MGARGARAATVDGRSDAELATDAAAGDPGAFEALYRRHADTAWRVAYSVTGNPDDAADAVSEAFTRVLQALPAGRLADASLVRSYLLSATRNAAIDISRRGGRVRSTDKLEHLDDRTKVSSPTDGVTDREDVSLVARAFRSLPERWRSVLWLTEVEGIPPREAAALLGVTPNNAAQLAVRARAGLRERFVQAHLSGPVPAECRTTVENLGAYITGRLAPRDLAKADQHLAGCTECAKRRDDLEDVGGVLRRIVLPLPLLLGPAALTKWKAAFAASSAAAPSAGVAVEGAASAGRVTRWTDLGMRLQKPLMAATTGIFAVGVIVAAPHVLGSPRGGRPSLAHRVPLVEGAQPAPTPATVPPAPVRIVTASNAAFTTALDGALDDADEAASDALVPQPDDPAPAAPLPPTTPEPIASPAPTPQPPAPPPPPPNDGSTSTVEVGVAAVAGPIRFGVVLGDDCQGGSLGSQSIGNCPAPAPEPSTLGVTLTTGGTTPIAGQKLTLGF
ncbi:MAG TPA: sigma-70 family RNA polymerase sigma factor [Acidimicrobiales bacterium]|nr:sigma-70 family RNA polymerase sigma factor [Acidimicrobiales bacterium]